MSGWQGKSRGNKLGYAIVINVTKYFGIFPAYFLLRFISLYFFLFSRQSSRVQYIYFRERLGLNRFAAYQSLYRNYYVFAQTLLDKIIVQAGNKHPFTFELEKEENLRAIIQKGKGGLLISAHIGSWEVAGHLLTSFDTKVSIVMFDGEQQALKNYVDQVTGGRKVNIIIVKDDLSHVYRIGEALQNNELVCLHADRFLPGNKTQKLKFLNAQAEFPVGPFVLASTFKVPVSFVFGFKESKTHYHLYGSPMIEFDPTVPKDKAVAELMAKFIETLELMVRRYPEHWFNYYDFWLK